MVRVLVLQPYASQLGAAPTPDSRSHLFGLSEVLLLVSFGLVRSFSSTPERVPTKAHLTGSVPMSSGFSREVRYALIHIGFRLRH